jgi:sugar phosphate isomerase/epimerase
MNNEKRGCFTMPKFGVSLYSISRLITGGQLTPEEAVDWLCAQGAEVIEIVPFGLDILEDGTLPARIRQAAEKHGVPVDNYSLNANFLLITEEERQAEPARVKRHMDAAGQMGVSTFRCDCAGYRRPLEMNMIENFLEDLPTILRVYTELCEYAALKNIKMLIENHGFHINGSDRVRLIITEMQKRVNNFGHQLDTGNYCCVDDIPEMAVKKMLPFAVTIHMKDFYIRDRDPGDATQFDCSGSWFRSVGARYLRGSILGQGDIDIPRVLKMIKDSGFNGNMYIEYEGMEDCQYGTKVSLENLKRLYAAV